MNQMEHLLTCLGGLSVSNDRWISAANGLCVRVEYTLEYSNTIGTTLLKTGGKGGIEAPTTKSPIDPEVAAPNHRKDTRDSRERGNRKEMNKLDTLLTTDHKTFESAEYIGYPPY